MKTYPLILLFGAAVTVSSVTLAANMPAPPPAPTLSNFQSSAACVNYIKATNAYISAVLKVKYQFNLANTSGWYTNNAKTDRSSQNHMACINDQCTRYIGMSPGANSGDDTVCAMLTYNASQGPQQALNVMKSAYKILMQNVSDSNSQGIGLASRGFGIYGPKSTCPDHSGSYKACNVVGGILYTTSN